MRELEEAVELLGLRGLLEEVPQRQVHDVEEVPQEQCEGPGKAAEDFQQLGVELRRPSREDEVAHETGLLPQLGLLDVGEVAHEAGLLEAFGLLDKLRKRRRQEKEHPAEDLDGHR